MASALGSSTKTGLLAHDSARGLFIRRRVDHQHSYRLLTDGREHVRHLGREEAAVAWSELARLASDLGPRAALEHVADLLDAGMGVGQGTLAFFDDAKHDLELLGTDV